MTEKKRYRVVYDRNNCIGIGSCALLQPERWVMIRNGNDNRADLIGGIAQKDGILVAEFTEEEFVQFKSAAESCPVNVIHIIDVETGEKII